MRAKKLSSDLVLKDAKNKPELVKLQKEVKDSVIEQLVAKRKAKNYTQSDISVITGIQRPNISRFESGAYNPTLDMLVRLADSMDLRVKISFVEK
ncbi:MAG: helix-turn-helix domain-containing protein [Butyrivibrio sp.]